MGKNRLSFNQIFAVMLILIAVFINFSCDKKNPESKEANEYIHSILIERAEKDSSMQYDPYSPFIRDTSVTFHPLKYFKPNPDFVFKSKLFLYNPQDTVKIMGTKGEARLVLLIGYVELKKDDNVYKVNVYKGFSRTGEPYYSIWFTDKTTGKETYGVGRYLDFEFNPDPNFIYTIDFNNTYNPYCAYSYLFTCPVPREEDYIDMSIEAGEKKFH
ncbi:MAG: DUF1684 domain-containing protein [Psychromonas sp.]|nr:DUF1684 domain-containing protein [Psychromonas sp.]